MKREHNHEEKKSAAKRLIQECANRWPSQMVARTEIPNFTGGALAARTVGNHDSAGTGVQGAFKIGKKTVYPKDNLVAWLISRLEV
jgi:hypothetical protein